MYTYDTHMYVCVSIYIYIYIWRGGEICFRMSLAVGIYVSSYTFVKLRIYMHS